jgi:type IX secretion system PorP/SprF family membrane protein
MRYILILNILLIANIVAAQRHLFSQFNASPLSMNPALTGVFTETYKFSVGQRLQTHGILNEAFNTSYFSGEKNFSVGKGTNLFGTGIQVVKDQTSKVGIYTTSIYSSISYIKSINKLFISTGFQIGGTSKNYQGNVSLPDDPDQVYNVSQLGNYKDIKRIEFNTGFFTSYRINDINRIYFGLGVFNINQSKDNFYENRVDITPIYNFHLGLRFYTKGEKLAVIPQSRILINNGASNYLIGSSFEYNINTDDLNNNNFISFGGWISSGNDYNGMIGLGINNWTFGVSFGSCNIYNTNELHLNYKIKKKNYTIFSNPCPRI